MSLHYSTYSTCCFEATVHYIGYFSGRKNWVAFLLINWYLTLCMYVRTYVAESSNKR